MPLFGGAFLFLENNMDLSTLDVKAVAEEGATLEVRHPVTGNLIDGMSVKVLGTDSATYRNAVKARIRRAANQRKKQDFDPDKAERDALELLADLTVGWDGVELDGEPLKCTRENCIMVYGRFPWLREQVDEFVADRANFLPNA